MRHHHSLHGTELTNWRTDQEITTLYKQGKIRWQPIEANEDYMRLSVNTPEQGSEEWIESCSNETLHPSIEEIKDEDK